MADRFYVSAHNTSRQIRTDGGRKEAESNCNLGKAAERKKDFEKAIQLYKQFYYLTKDKPWRDEKDDCPLYNKACHHLLTAHVLFSEQVCLFV